MKKKVQDVYSEILRLRNEFYQQWQENDEPSDHNRIILKAKYEAFDKALELLTPSIVDPQPKESIEYNPFDYFRHTDSEEPVSEDLEEEWKRYITSEEYLNDIPGGLPVARHFANWQKQQMMNGAIEAEILEIYYPTGSSLEISTRIPEDKYEAGDKVKLIIIKER